MTADKGLAGAFNANLIAPAELHGRENPNVAWYASGSRRATRCAARAARRCSSGRSPKA
jgi:F0F1-type ATP synthase gamma subunit